MKNITAVTFFSRYRGYSSSYLSYCKRFLSFAGPGYLIAVGYMDPGNWATGLIGGSRYGYTLLSMILISNVIALLLQYCSLKLGIVTGKDLAQACRNYYHPLIAFGLWILAEIAVIATDLAKVIGSAIGLQLLFGIPLMWGITLTVCDVLVFLFFTQHHARRMQALITVLIALIMGCFAIIIYLVHPCWSSVATGFVPSFSLIKDPELLYVAIGILGATVMPHNLYLHSALVVPAAAEKKEEAIFYSALDLGSALTFAFFVNAAILIVAAGLFYKHALHHVAEIQQAYHLFTPLLQTHVASFVFAFALLLSGQNSTITGTLAGQVIMEGFINFFVPSWLRRLIGRVITIIPALIGVMMFGDGCISTLLLFSQVVLSLQLPFAVFPLLQFTSSSKIMGRFANGLFIKSTAYCTAFMIVAANVLLIYFFMKT